MAVNTKVTVFRDVMSHSLVEWYQHFGGTNHLHLQATGGTLQMKAAGSFEGVTPFYQIVWHHMPVVIVASSMVSIEFYFLGCFQRLIN
jgi:hypothetical protein